MQALLRRWVWLEAIVHRGCCCRHSSGRNAHRAGWQQKAEITKALVLINMICEIASVELCGNTALALRLQWWLLVL
jgi:hypothetical protein